MASKMRAQTVWSLEWHRDNKERLRSNTPSGFELADINPHKSSPKDTFRSTPRFGRLHQTLAGHGYTGEFYQLFVPTESTWCRCTDPEKTYNFDHTDPIDGSVSKNQGQVVTFEGGSGVGEKELMRDAQDGLKGLIEVALELSKFLGREKPTVITQTKCPTAVPGSSREPLP